MSNLSLLRGTSVALLAFAVIPLVAFIAVGYVVPVALLAAGLVLLDRRPRAAAVLVAVAAGILGGGVLWAGWILGVAVNRDPVPGGLELVLLVALPLAAVACLVAATRVWLTAGRTPVRA